MSTLQKPAEQPLSGRPDGSRTDVDASPGTADAVCRVCPVKAASEIAEQNAVRSDFQKVADSQGDGGLFGLPEEYRLPDVFPPVGGRAAIMMLLSGDG